jgi:hypothetical protein
VVSSLKLYSPEEMFYIPSGFFVFLKMISRFFDAFRQESICYRATIKLLVIG